jgi:voltage-dependent anion channel protein 2
LNDDYISKISLKCKKSAGPVAVTIDAQQGSDGALSTKTGYKFSYAKFNVDKGEVHSDGGCAVETSLVVTPDVKFSFKSVGKGADLGVDFTKGNFYATGILDVANMSKFTTSACLGLAPGLKLGGDATYSISGITGLSAFNMGASYTKGPLFSSLTATSKFSKFNIGLVYKVNPDISLASQSTHSSGKFCDTLAIGGAYKAAKIGTIKAKVGSDGIISACVVREIAPSVMLTASGSMNAKEPATFKPGLAISM